MQGAVRMTYDEWEELMAKTRKWRCTNCGRTKTQTDMPSMQGCTQNKNGVHAWVKKDVEEE
jgi:hypothetical protein